ncbi:flagellar assembly peptidoglycan hydrolase FlgJ [Aquabacterium sp. A7-Y]|uniref:flagellar assembly peptidoglycan hydrolase FlgJ n=1 Tax=Aquabacterium sp. A7-Y TaxID=1349605 RepID=UPI00223D7575|nr:flagellar assembly peptidoglycan hydrolase FlgJ [Aquabacterium sp. A7-Y]MCW7540507.1 flagellar assembly peptidoglycan hydrolase FlgJ [Aquabacterium sp. A7-Y]
MSVDSVRVPTQGLASDSRSLDALKSVSSKDPKAAIKEAAKQFEAVFMQQLMKTMRDSTMKSGMLDNEGSDMGTEMLDTQYATKMSGLPGGLADVIARQLSRHMGGPEATTSAEVTQRRLPAALQGLPKSVAIPKASGAQGDFLRENWNAAQAASQETGIPAEFVLAQAAHESGWGRRDIRMADGSPSHNLFGIKATGSWKGKVAEVTTTEYVNGQPRKVVAKFRAYDTAEDAFRDYARLLKNNDRYAGVMREGQTAQGFAQGLQKAGYATDPAYADKLTRIINTTLRLQRAAT